MDARRERRRRASTRRTRDGRRRTPTWGRQAARAATTAAPATTAAAGDGGAGKTAAAATTAAAARDAGDGGAGNGGGGNDGAARDRRHGRHGHGGRPAARRGAGTAGTARHGVARARPARTAAAGSDGAMDLPPETTPPPPACYTVTFTKPVNQAQLSAADDKNGDQCVDGFQYDVVITTAAPDGTSVQLFGGASLLKTAHGLGRHGDLRQRPARLVGQHEPLDPVPVDDDLHGRDDEGQGDGRLLRADVRGVEADHQPDAPDAQRRARRRWAAIAPARTARPTRWRSR